MSDAVITYDVFLSYNWRDQTAVEAVAFSPDGKWVATASGRTARVWLRRSEDLIAEACARLTRNLTLEEWRQYVGDEPYRKTCPNLPGPEQQKRRAG